MHKTVMCNAQKYKQTTKFSVTLLQTQHVTINRHVQYTKILVYNAQKSFRKGLSKLLTFQMLTIQWKWNMNFSIYVYTRNHYRHS